MQEPEDHAPRSEKDQLRQEVWSRLKQEGVSRRDPVGHIPSFFGSEQAAERLATLSIWQQAQVIKCNPDSPHSPVRLQALQDGKRLYMAVPRLTNQRCFVELYGPELQQRGIALETAAIARQALIYGRSVRFAEMEPIDLVVVGCVAVTRTGGRTGKGAGYADLELAMLQQHGLVQTNTPIVTTVHPLQIVDASRLPMLPHDWPIDWIITPDQVIETQTTYPRPQGLDWNTIRPEQLKAIPILRSLKVQRC